MNARMALIGHAALFLQRFGYAFLVSGDESVALVWLHRRGGDDIDHFVSPSLFLFQRTATLAGV
jgi:hypothetical protein